MSNFYLAFTQNHKKDTKNYTNYFEMLYQIITNYYRKLIANNIKGRHKDFTFMI